MHLIVSLMISIGVTAAGLGYLYYQYQEQQAARTAGASSTAGQGAVPAGSGPYAVNLRQSERRPAILENLDLLRQEPCHRAAALELTEELNRVNGFRNAVTIGTAFRERCGPDETR